MKKIMLLLCGLAVIGLIVSALAADQKQSGQTTPKTDIEKLTKRIDALQAKVKALEERVGELEKWKVAPVLTPLAGNPAPQILAAPQANVDPNRPPNALSEREFNGMKYYLMPLSSGDN